MSAESPCTADDLSNRTEPPRHAAALGQRLWRAGAGLAVAHAGIRRLRRRRGSRAGSRRRARRARTRWRPSRRTSRRRPGASSSCSWTAGRRRWTRSTPSLGSTASTASRSRSRRTRRSSTTSATCCGCPWKFRNYGESGIPVSDLFPHVGQCVDDLAIIRSMVSNFSEHTNANYFMHTGSGLQGRPSHGAWVTYGLGSECQDLPGFRGPERRLDPAGGHRLLQQRVPARVLSGVGLQAGGRAGGEHHADGADARAAAQKARSAAHARPGGAGAHGPPRQPGSGDRQLRAGLPDAVGGPRAHELAAASPRRPSGSTASTIPIRRRRSSRANA